MKKKNLILIFILSLFAAKMEAQCVSVGSTQTICQGGAASSLGGAEMNGTSAVIWSDNAGGSFTPGATTLDATWHPPAGYSGTATLTLTATAGCLSSPSSAPLSVIVTPMPVATFSYATSPYCSNEANPSPTFSGGGAAGTFSSTSGLVFVSTATGQVDLAASTAGTYIVTNTIAAAGGCGIVSSTAQIIITKLPVATFSYTTSPYCSNEANPSPTFSGGGVAGTFSSTSGLVFVSTATGQVDLAASTAGTYIVTNTIAAAGGCGIVSSTAQIIITKLPVATFSYATSPYCSNEANPSPTFSGGGVAGIFSSTSGLAFVSTATGQVNLATSTAGTYIVTNTIAAAGGCGIVSSTAQIIITKLPVATFSYATSPYCSNEANPSPTFSGGGVAGIFSSTSGLAFVSTATGQVNLATSTAGTYTVTNTIAAAGGCGIVSSTAQIVITALPVATFSYSGSPYCSNAANPSPTFSGGGVAGLFSSTSGLVFVSTATGQVNLAASTAGTYTVTNTLAAAGGCGIVSSTAQITITALPIATFSYSGNPYCSNASNPSPTFSGGGVAGTFSSTAGLVFVSASTGQVNLAASTPGVYTVTNTLPAAGACGVVTATSPITVTMPLSATIYYTGSPWCGTAGVQNVTMSGTPGGTYSAVPAGLSINTSTGAIATNTSTAGTYTVIYTMAASGGCGSATATTSVTISPTPSAPTLGTITQPTCSVASGSVVLNDLPITGTGTWTLTRSPGGVISVGTGSTTTISNLGAGSYTYTVANSVGCISPSSGSIVINAQPASPTAPVQSINCASGPDHAVVTITSPVGTGLEYSLHLGSFSSAYQTSPIFTEVLNSVGSATYYFTVRNSAGCITTGSPFTVSCGCVSPPSVTLSSTTGSTCGTTAVTVTGNTFGGSATSVLITSDGNGTLNPTSSSTSPFSFTYTPVASDGGKTVKITVTTNNPAGSPCVVGAQTYSLTVNTVPSAPVVGTITQTTCALSTGSVVLSGLPATGTWTLTRSPGGVIISGSGTSVTVPTIPSGTYTFNVANSTGCVSSASANVLINAQPLIPPAPTVGTITAPTCALATGSVVLSGLPSSGTWTLIRYPGIISTNGTGASSTVTGLPAGTYNFTVTNADGCLSVSSANVVISSQPASPSAPVIGTITQPTFSVPTGSVVLTGLPSTGSWIITTLPGGVTTAGAGASKTITNLAGGVYTFTVKNSSGCTSAESAQVTISTPGIPVLVISNPPAVCSPSKVDITSSLITVGSTGGLIYTYWTDAGATIPYSTPTAAVAGTYYIKATTVSGYFDIKPVIVTITPLPVPNPGPDQTLDYEFSTALDASLLNSETGIWSLLSGTGDFDSVTDPKTTITGLSAGENDLLWTVKTAVCPPVSDTVKIVVNNFIIPTLITPNMDGRNDYFVLRGLSTLGKTELTIFDRRGALVYRNLDYDNSWNGVDYNKNPLPDDTYFYVLKTNNGKSISGYIVIRH